MALPTPRNLGSLRQELRDRLGFASSGSNAGPNTSIIDSFLRQAQEQIYYEYVPRTHIGNTSISTNDGQVLYDWPDECNPNRLITIVCRDTTSSNPSRHELIEGIEYFHRDYSTPKAKPERFERTDQIEVWPQPDGNQYRIDLEYVKRLNAFTLDAHTVTLDAELILLLALANAKSHYRHQDAGIYAQQLTQMLSQIKAHERQSEKRYIRSGRNRSRANFSLYFDNIMRHEHTDDV